MHALTNPNDDKRCHSVENAEVPHSKDNMVEKKSHQAAQSDAGESKERQKDFKENKKKTESVPIPTKSSKRNDTRNRSHYLDGADHCKPGLHFFFRWNFIFNSCKMKK